MRSNKVIGQVRSIRTCEIYDVRYGTPLGMHIKSNRMYDLIRYSKLPDKTPCAVISLKGFPYGVKVKNTCFQTTEETGHVIMY